LRDTLKLTVGADGELRCQLPDSPEASLPVTVRPAFPLSNGHGQLVVFDLQGRTLGLVSDMQALPEAVREVCLQAYRVMQVRRVRSARAEGDCIRWEVETEDGAHSFESEDKVTSYVRLKGEVWVVRASDGTYYRFPPLADLDEESYWEVEHYLQAPSRDTGDPLARS